MNYFAADNDNARAIVRPVIPADTITIGSKYEATKGLDLAEVAKLVRADIKAALASGNLPAGVECSVRISRYSMGQSLDVRITAAPFPVRVPGEQVDGNRADGLKYPWLTREAAALFETVQGIVDAYNHERSNHGSDYHHSRFHGTVEFAIKRSTEAA